MRLEKLKINGFRNFEQIEVNLNQSTLLIGPNDVGKTNLIYALRILFDKSLSIDDITLKDSDFNVNNNKNELTIIVSITDFNEVDDEKIISKHGKSRNCSDGRLYIGYKAYRYNEEPFEFFIGDSWAIVDNPLCKIDGRTYLNSIYMAYLDSSRLLGSFLKTAKRRMIDNFKNGRDDSVVEEDNLYISNAKTHYNEANIELEKVSYIKDSAGFISKRMSDFDEKDKDNITLSVSDSFDDFERNLELVSVVDGKKVEIGGDGRSNEIYLIMWIFEQINIAKKKNCKVIFAIEEPENHLYFPLQSLISQNIQEYLKEYQYIVSSHSPVIFNNFNPSSIVRLKYDNSNKTKVVNNGCTNALLDSFYTFGFRHNIMTNEMFFADSVLLVEGISEKLLYSTISKVNDNILEKKNVRVIQVDGVGFSVYVKILRSLDIKFAIRTDNDFIPVKYGTGRKKTRYYMGGLIRLIELYNEYSLGNYVFDKSLFDKLDKPKIPRRLNSTYKEYVLELEKANLFLSKVDLEYDTFYSPLNCEIINYYSTKGITTPDDIIEEMRKSKGNNMFDLLQKIDLNELKKVNKKTPLVKALLRAIDLGESKC